MEKVSFGLTARPNISPSSCYRFDKYQKKKIDWVIPLRSRFGTSKTSKRRCSGWTFFLKVE
jgi:hypothetical protein